MPIHTPRLELIPATPELLRAELRGRAALQAVLGVCIPVSWPPDLYDDAALRYTIARMEEAPERHTPEHQAWWLYYFVRRATGSEPAVVVGGGGFKGPPVQGTVEVGYSVLAEHRRRGYASEATEGFVAFAFAHPEVQRVVAQTLPDLTASIGVLQKCGFRLVGAGTEQGAICFEMTRSAWAQRAGFFT